MKTALGTILDLDQAYPNITEALANIPRHGYGYIWVLRGNHWVIAGNYAGGKAWQGADSRVVPATVEGLAYLARHS